MGRPTTGNTGSSSLSGWPCELLKVNQSRPKRNSTRSSSQNREEEPVSRWVAMICPPRTLRSDEPNNRSGRYISQAAAVSETGFSAAGFCFFRPAEPVGSLAGFDSSVVWPVGASWFRRRQLPRVTVITQRSHFAFAPLTGPNHDISVRSSGPNRPDNRTAGQRETTESLGKRAASLPASRVARVSLPAVELRH